jgi:hypothetical protein
VITKPSDIGKMPFEQFEQFDKRNKSESPNNDAGHVTPNDPNDMNGILHHPDDPGLQNTTSRKEIYHSASSQLRLLKSIGVSEMEKELDNKYKITETACR